MYAVLVTYTIRFKVVSGRNPKSIKTDSLIVLAVSLHFGCSFLRLLLKSTFLTFNV